MLLWFGGTPCRVINKTLYRTSLIQNFDTHTHLLHVICVITVNYELDQNLLRHFSYIYWVYIFYLSVIIFFRGSVLSAMYLQTNFSYLPDVFYFSISFVCKNSLSFFPIGLGIVEQWLWLFCLFCFVTNKWRTYIKFQISDACIHQFFSLEIVSLFGLASWFAENLGRSSF